ncbi:hypothetical protein EW146_g3292 [Bondarzewia mesenterica]|uniref:ubiquitinyl hydrolase 1 n=1 Tax=Bondarzewia mesenterica TaxID=1095465 RepID=A0A4S4LXZ1_9AGAM|nr:hypothetical protein EW146_g3292 [Bondarzewia mesenterica]
MTLKRKRRIVSNSEGLAAGERLKRHKLADGSDSSWGWVGTEVLDVSEISREHRLATCGFARSASFCPNRYMRRAPKASTSVNHVATAEGELADDVIVISDDEAPHCSKKYCRKNPNCLNYLGQEKWENEENAMKEYLAAANMGRDPSLGNRQSDFPVGLKNLGATCYANAYIQVWFQDLAFRNGVYRCQPSQDKENAFEESPIFQLQATFAALQAGKKRVFNPTKLVESLKLRANEQQDAQEFSKLFMSHLDTEFQKQSDPALKNLLSNQVRIHFPGSPSSACIQLGCFDFQFQGIQVYTTLCQACGNRSERESDFLEIEVNLENNATLESRIEAVLQPEILSGDNKYHCPRCETLEDATRQVILRKLPPILHFSLLRFVFDISTLERKKSKHNISFPRVLDMNRFLENPPADKDENVYDLKGVLLHRGPSAYHGHYEALVFDVTNDSWFQFNDEVVTKMQPPGSKTGGDKEKAKGFVYRHYLPPTLSQQLFSLQSNKGRPNAKKARRIEDSDDEIVEVDPPSSQIQGSQSPDTSYVNSKDAYMLIYARRRPIGENARRETRDPPSRALDAVRKLNNAHEEACAAFVEKQNTVKAKFQDSRNRMTNIYRSWHVLSNEQRSIVASQEALEMFLSRHLAKSSGKSSDAKDSTAENEATSGDDDQLASSPNTKLHINGSSSREGDIPIDGIICTHGKLDPLKAEDMKRIDYVCDEVASERMASEEKCHFFPEMTPEDVCEICVETIFMEKLYQYEHPKQVAQFDELLGMTGSGSYWISKHWLRDWRLAKPKMHTPSQMDPSPDSEPYGSHVKCEHGDLSLNTTARQRISRQVQFYILHENGSFLTSCQAYRLLLRLFPSWDTLSEDAEHCAARLKHMHDNALNGNTTLLEHVPCALIPAQFVREWREWILRPADNPRPDAVDNTSFFCTHEMLNIDPKSDLDSSMCLVRREDWLVLEELYGAGPLIEVENRPERDAKGVARTSFQHQIPVCMECRWRRKSDFDTTEVTLHILAANEVDPTPATYEPRSFKTSNTTPRQQTSIMTYAGSRKSKRIRQASERKDKRLSISKDMSVKAIKLLIQEQLNIPTICQRLFLRGKELDDNQASVADLGMLENDIIDMRQENEDVDLLEDSDVDQPKAKRRAEGRAFGGTLLGGMHSSSSLEDTMSERTPTPQDFVIACPACTLQNPATASICQICDTPLV